MIDRIYCKNFRRLEEADIVLRDGITCVVGNNGTGKSSLIEVIPFNLYGRVKSGTKKDSVRRRGAEEDDPTFTFIDFSLNNIHYRCRRYYTKKMSLMATLYSYTDEEYAKLLEQEDKLELNKELGTLIASSTTGVSEAVEKLLGVSYEGFKASFIAQQKELDALASLTLENRKKFFLDLLGYSHLDTIKPSISKSLKSVQDTVNTIEKQNLSVTEISRQIAALEKQLTVLSGRMEKGRSVVSKARSDHSEVAKQNESAQIASEKLSTALADIEALEAEETQLAEDIAALAESMERDAKTSEGYDENSSVATRIAALKEKIAASYAYNQAEAAVAKINAAIAVKEKDLANNARQISQLAAKTATEPDIDTPQAKITEAKSKQAAAAAEERELAKRLSSVESLIASVEAGEAAKCPTCGNQIADEHGRNHLANEAAELAEGRKAVSAKLSSYAEELAKSEAALAAARALLRTWQRDVNEKTKLEQRNDLLSRELEESRKQAELMKADLEAKAAGKMGEDERREAENELSRLEGALKRENEMKTAFYRLRQSAEKKAMSEKRLGVVKTTLAEKRKVVKENRALAAKAPNLAAKVKEGESKVDRYQEALTGLEREHAAAEASLKAATGNLAIAEKQSRDLARFKEDIEAHIGAQQVVELLRRELPSRIAPRLALEASHLLEIATGGAYSLIEIDDSYEVYIYTDDDVRPIAMMSGGEGDVIALCIRIAIAKLLLETSGIGKQTFILDEIFGALDAGRKESTCTALQNIGEQLSKILCITHIDEIKDMADWTYIVEMDEHGVSHVREYVEAAAIPPLP